jgi:glycerophosphoryl diester phosphodiesterase
LEIIAHRGVHHDFHKENLDNKTCTASRIYKPTHNYIENTIESVQTAFEFGATIVEIDVRATKDKQLVIFHDDRLECRTNAKGNIGDYSLDELRKLDIAYGYTYDGGKTYPFRGKAKGKIKTLAEVLHQFPDKKLLIHNKSGNNLEVAQLIIDILISLPKNQQRNIYLWSKNKAYEHIHNLCPYCYKIIYATPSTEKILYIVYIEFWFNRY